MNLDKLITIRVSSDEKKKLEKAAKQERQSVSSFIARWALEKSNDIIRGKNGKNPK